MSVQEESMRNENVPEKSITECEVMVMKCIWFRESACTASGILVDLEERYQEVLEAADDFHVPAQTGG